MCPTDKEGSSEPPAYAPFHQCFLLLQTLYETASILHSNVCHFVNLISATIFDGDFYYHFCTATFPSYTVWCNGVFYWAKKIPLIIRRYLPDKSYEDWVDELIIT